jgi:hypothetical protein
MLLFNSIVMAAGAVANDQGGSRTQSQDRSMGMRGEIELTTFYDSNIFASRSNREGDFVTLASPSLELQSGSARQNLLVDVGANLGHYWNHPNENFVDYRLILRGRDRLSARLQLFASLGTRQEHEGRDSPDADRSGDEPTTYLAHNADLGAIFASGAHQLRLGGTIEALRFDDVPSGDGTLINEDRDRNHYGLGLRLARRIAPETQVFLQAQYDRRDYLEPTDIFGFRRDSAGHRAALGIEHAAEGGRSVEGYLGYLGQRYEDPAFDDNATLDIGIALELPVSPGSRWSAELRRELLETTEFGASGYLLTGLSITFGRRIDDRLHVDADGYYGIGKFEQTARDDELIGLGASLEYALSNSWYATLGYQWTRRDARVPDTGDPLIDEGEDYDRHLISLSLRTSFGQEKK